MLYDLIIRNGHVIDPASQHDSVASVAIRDGRIAEVGEIEADASPELDAGGRYVLPGLIDLHTHLFKDLRTQRTQDG